MQSYVPGLPEKIALGVDLIVRISAEDLTQTTANTPQAVTIYKAKPGEFVGRVVTFLKTPFKDSADAAFNTTALTVGDAGSANRFLTSTELNENGTEVIHKANAATNFMYATATDILATFNAMTAKSLASLNVGEVYIGLEIKQTKGIGNFA